MLIFLISVSYPDIITRQTYWEKPDNFSKQRFKICINIFMKFLLDIDSLAPHRNDEGSR